MGRPRKLRNMVAKMNDPALLAMWDLRIQYIHSKTETKQIRDAIKERIRTIKARRICERLDG